MDNSIKNLYLSVKEKILNANSIAIITHINPDGDCIGSSFALSELIEFYGKHVDVYNEYACPEQYEFITNGRKLINDSESNGNKYDIVIFTDCGSIDRAGKVAWVYDGVDCIINIDHHSTNTMFGDINIVDGEATATGVLIYDMFVQCGVNIDKHTAELLYMAIATDSGNFSYANTDKRCHEIAGELIEKGVDVTGISQKLFRLTSYNRLKLMSLAFDTLKMYCNGRVAIITVSKAMFAETGTNSSDSEGFVSFIRDIKGVEIAAVLRDTTDGRLVKVSLRSNGNFDVSKIAEELGGGGHFNAAGCSIEGKIPDAEKIIIEILTKVVS